MRFFSGMIFGLVAGYLIYGNELAYIDAIKADKVSPFGETYILTSVGDVQVAVFHGYADNADACHAARDALEGNSIRECLPYHQAPYGTAWWHFWGKQPNKPR